MKNSSKFKLLASVISLLLIICAVFAIGTAAEGDASYTKPEISSQNICYQGDFALMYAVPTSSVNTEGEGDLFIKVYLDSALTTLCGTYAPDKDGEGNVITKTVNGESCYIFTTGGVPAKEMQTVFYSQVTDNRGNKSAVKKYSVVEYCLEKLTEDITPAQERLFNNVLNLGASAEEVLLSKTEKLATDLKYVYTEDADVTVDGTYDAVTAFAGETVTPTYSGAVPEGFAVKFKAAGVTYASGTAIAVTDHTKIELVLEKPKMTFDSHTVEANGAWIQDDGTGAKFNPKESAAYEVKEENGNKYLATTFGASSYYSFGQTTFAADGYNAIAYQSDMRFSADSAEGAALTVTLHKNSSTKQVSVKLSVDASGNVLLSRATDSSASTYSEGIAVAKIGEWFNLRVEYVIRYGRLTTTVTVNDKLIYLGNGCNTTTSSADLVRAQINSAAAAVSFDIDEVIVEKFVGDTGYTFDFEEATSISNYGYLIWAVGGDTADGEGAAIKTDLAHGNYLEATMLGADSVKFDTLTEDVSGYNAFVFEAKVKLDGTTPYVYLIPSATNSMQVRIALDENGVYLLNNSGTTPTTVSSTVQKGEWFTVRITYTASETDGSVNCEMTVIAADGTEFTGTGVSAGAIGKSNMLIRGNSTMDGTVCLDDVTLKRIVK